jgi:sugar/nucleoside kinase (ribokinase family)
VNVDRFLRLKLFPAPDRTVPVAANRIALGGTAATLARVASSYGVRTGIVARVGTEFPAEFRRALRTARIDLRGVETVPSAPTPTCYIMEDEDGGQRTLIDQGPMGDAARASLPAAMLHQYSWLHVTTGDPTFQLRLARLAGRTRVRVAADPAQEIHYRWDRRSLTELLGLSEILFGNRAEIAHAVALVGGGGTDALLARVPLVVRTEGPDGVSAFTRAGVRHVPATRARRVRSAVGAGDAFRGGFYAAWFEGEPLERCLRAGTRAGARWMEGASPRGP